MSTLFLRKVSGIGLSFFTANIGFGVGTGGKTFATHGCALPKFLFGDIAGNLIAAIYIYQFGTRDFCMPKCIGNGTSRAYVYAGCTSSATGFQNSLRSRKRGICQN